MKPFIGRTYELKQLKELSNAGQASIVAIKGRRRIGKSRLVTEFASDKIFLPFIGLAPTTSITAQEQRDHFTNQLALLFNLPPFHCSDWDDIFKHLSKYITDKETVILFDEISWMGAGDNTFISKIKSWWDRELSQRKNVMLVFCGSVSTWIEENIINSTAFFGRISLVLELTSLTLKESAEFLQVLGFKASHYDIFKLLSVIGGVPWYLEQIHPNEMADNNIKRLCFEKNGLLTLEFNRIFNDLFNTKGEIYKKIIYLLSNGMKSLAEIRETLKYPHSGSLSRIMKNLIISGFVTQHYQWSIKTNKLSKQSLYRLSDCYMRFYIKYIEPNMIKIQQNAYRDVELSTLPNWQPNLGFQVESLLLQNRSFLLSAIGVNIADVVMDNPYVQHTTTRQKGCQIDYLVQTYTKNLFFCEFKFKRREIGLEIIEEMQAKLKSFSAPRGFGTLPVLFHLGDVAASVYEKNYFYKIIDITDFIDNAE